MLDLSAVVFIPHVSDLDTNEVASTSRTIPESLSPVWENLELRHPQLVPLADLRTMRERHRIGRDPRAVEWLSDAAFEIDESELLKELESRPSSVAQRTGYLLQEGAPRPRRNRSQYLCGSRNCQNGNARGSDSIWLEMDGIGHPFFRPRELEALKRPTSC